MPFTFSHPTYAFPLKYISPKYFSLTGLILGSMAPDFEYFLMLEPYRSIGHSLLGLFMHAIPLSVLFAYIFHFIVKESFAAHLPSTYKISHRAFNLLGEWRLRHFKSWIIFISSVAIGFMSHIFVDELTHIHGFFVVRFSIFNELIIFNLPLYKILQYGLSIIGLLLASGLIIFRLSRSNPASRMIPRVELKQKVMYWLIVIAVSVVVTILKLLITNSTNIIGIIVVAPITGICFGLVLASILSRRQIL